MILFVNILNLNNLDNKCFPRAVHCLFLLFVIESVTAYFSNEQSAWQQSEVSSSPAEHNSIHQSSPGCGQPSFHHDPSTPLVHSFVWYCWCYALYFVDSHFCMYLGGFCLINLKSSLKAQML